MILEADTSPFSLVARGFAFGIFAVKRQIPN